MRLVRVKRGPLRLVRFLTGLGFAMSGIIASTRSNRAAMSDMSSKASLKLSAFPSVVIVWTPLSMTIRRVSNVVPFD